MRIEGLNAFGVMSLSPGPGDTSCDTADAEEEQCPEQRAGCVCHDIVQLAVASSGGKLYELKEETAGKAGQGAERDPL